MRLDFYCSVKFTYTVTRIIPEALARLKVVYCIPTKCTDTIEHGLKTICLIRS